MRNKGNITRLLFMVSFVIVFLSLFPINSFAGTGGEDITNPVDLVEEEDGVKYLIFETPGTPSSATYKHRTYGESHTSYWVRSTDKTVFL